MTVNIYGMKLNEGYFSSGTITIPQELLPFITIQVI